MARLLNEIKDENKLIQKIFFYGDYSAYQTESGKEESGIRLCFDLPETLSKKEVEELYSLVIKGLVTQEKFYDAKDNDNAEM